MILGTTDLMKFIPLATVIGLVHNTMVPWIHLSKVRVRN